MKKEKKKRESYSLIHTNKRVIKMIILNLLNFRKYYKVKTFEHELNIIKNLDLSHRISISFGLVFKFFLLI